MTPKNPVLHLLVKQMVEIGNNTTDKFNDNHGSYLPYYNPCTNLLSVVLFFVCWWARPTAFSPPRRVRMSWLFGGGKGRAPTVETAGEAVPKHSGAVYAAIPFQARDSRTHTPGWV